MITPNCPVMHQAWVVKLGWDGQGQKYSSWFQKNSHLWLWSAWYQWDADWPWVDEKRPPQSNFLPPPLPSLSACRRPPSWIYGAGRVGPGWVEAVCGHKSVNFLSIWNCSSCNIFHTGKSCATIMNMLDGGGWVCGHKWGNFLLLLDRTHHNTPSLVCSF